MEVYFNSKNCAKNTHFPQNYLSLSPSLLTTFYETQCGEVYSARLHNITLSKLYVSKAPDCVYLSSEYIKRMLFLFIIYHTKNAFSIDVTEQKNIEPNECIQNEDKVRHRDRPISYARIISVMSILYHIIRNIPVLNRSQ